QSLFADELSTYWIVATHSFSGVWELLYGTYPRIPHAEITPPLFFILSWASSQLGHAPELVRLPSLIAGTLTIPVVYLVGVRAVVPWTHGLINNIDSPTAKILSALSPFNPHDIRLDLQHWTIGFPYVEAGGLRGLPGVAALVLYALAAAIVAAGLIDGARRL